MLAGEPGALETIAVTGMPAGGGGTLVLDGDVIGLDHPRLLFGSAVSAPDGRTTNALVEVNLRSGARRVRPLDGGRLTRDAAFLPFAPISVVPPRVGLGAASRRSADILLLARGKAVSRVAAACGRAPRTGGRFRFFGTVAVGARAVLFAAGVGGGRTDGGVFLGERGRVKPLLIEGDAAPGGGTVGAIDEALVPLAIDDRRAAFVVPVVLDGALRDALFVASGPILRLVAREGDATPVGTIGAFGGPGSVVLVGDTAVSAGSLTGSGAAAALFACSDLRCD